LSNSSKENIALHHNVSELNRIVDSVPGVLFQFRRKQEGDYQFDYLSSGIGDLLRASEESSVIDRFVGRGGWDFVYERIVAEDRDALICSIERSAEKLTQWEQTFRIKSMDGKIIWLDGMANPYKLDDGHIIWCGMAMETPSQGKPSHEDSEQQLRRELEEKEFLLKEVNHRVKNNMQVIASLLYLQAESVESPTAARYLLESRNRVQSMAIAHEILYNTSDLKTIELEDYLNRLIQQISYVYSQKTEDHDYLVDVENLALNLKTVVIIGLLVNELVTNSLKHAFKEGESGTIAVSGGLLDNEKMKLQVSDNGMGLPEDLDPDNSDSLGMQIIQSLASQLSGDYVYKTDEKGGGTIFEVVFEAD